MISCHGLVHTNTQDLYYLLRGNLSIASLGKIPAENMPVLVLGVDNLRRVKDELENHSVLVLDAAVKFSGLSIDIVDNRPLTAQKLRILLKTKTLPIRLVKKTDPVNKILARNSSVLAPFLHAKYMKKDDKRAQFIEQFKTALLSGKTSNNELEQMLSTKKGIALSRAVCELQGNDIDQLARKYKIAPFDLHYINRLFY